MTTEDTGEPFKIGTIVRIRGSRIMRAKIVEYRGPLGPKGARVYRLLFSEKPAKYIEVLEEQLEVESVEK